MADIDNTDESKEEESAHGNTRLPFGLCKRYGIPLPDYATPRMAWEALKRGTGLTPDQIYDHLASGKELPQKLPEQAREITNLSDNEVAKFVPANSTQEAETYARNSLGINYADYKGIDLEVANEMNAAIKRGMDICPKIKDRMKSIGNAQRVNKAFREEYAAAVEQYARSRNPWVSDEYCKKFGKQRANKVIKGMPSTAVALARAGSSPVAELNAVIKKYEGIIANEKLCKDGKHLREILEFNEKIGQLSVGTVAGTFDHEVAHQIDFALGLSKNVEMVSLWRSLSKQEIASGLSKYGTETISEFIAEGWAEYCNKDNPRPIAKKIGEIIEREAKR